MRLSRWKIVAVLALAMALSLAFAYQALATATVIENPDAAYLSSTTKIPTPQTYTRVTSVADADLRVNFNAAYESLPFSFAWDWGNAGEVETLNPVSAWKSVGVAGGNWTLSRPVYVFGFEAGPQGPDYSTDITATFILSRDDQVVGTVHRMIRASSTERNVHARLFAVSSDVAFDRVQIAAPIGLMYHNIRYRLGVPFSTDIGGGVGDQADDTYLYSYRPTTAYSASTANFVGKTASGEERTLLRFPLDKLEGKTVTSATVSLTKSTSGSYIPLRAYRLRRPVTSSASWNNFQTGGAWGLAGAKDPLSDFYNDRFAASSNGTFQVGDLLKNAIASGSDTLDLLVVDPDPVAGRYNGFYSANCVYPAYRPKLTVEGYATP